jgi:putative membrane protein
MWILPRHLIRGCCTFASMQFLPALVPGIKAFPWRTTVILALFVAVAGLITETLAGRDISPFARGLIGAVLVFAVTGGFSLLFSSFPIPVWLLLFISVLVGLIDLAIPVRARWRD